MRLDSWILHKKNQQDWVTDWMDVVAREGEVKDPSTIEMKILMLNLNPVVLNCMGI